MSQLSCNMAVKSHSAIKQSHRCTPRILKQLCTGEGGPFLRLAYSCVWVSQLLKVSEQVGTCVVPEIYRHCGYASGKGAWEK